MRVTFPTTYLHSFISYLWVVGFRFLIPGGQASIIISAVLLLCTVSVPCAATTRFSAIQYQYYFYHMEYDVRGTLSASREQDFGQKREYSIWGVIRKGAIGSLIISLVLRFPNVLNLKSHSVDGEIMIQFQGMLSLTVG